MLSKPLTVQHVRFFETFGFLYLPGLFADSIEKIIASFEEVWAANGEGHNGKPHDQKARSVLVRFIDQHDNLRTLLVDPRIEGIAASLVGEDFNYMGSDGNYYVGDSRWHSDDWDKDIRHIKFLFYLDPLTRDTGALRVLPGSHKIGDAYAEGLRTLSIVDEEFKTSEQTEIHFGVRARDIPAVALEAQPSDVIVIDHGCKHSSFGGGLYRRMFSILCSQRYPTDYIAELRKYLGTYARFWIDRAYDKQMIDTARPQRRIHLEQVMANDDHLAELAHRKRLEMPEPSRDQLTFPAQRPDKRLETLPSSAS